MSFLKADQSLGVVSYSKPKQMRFNFDTQIKIYWLLCQSNHDQIETKGSRRSREENKLHVTIQTKQIKIEILIKG